MNLETQKIYSKNSQKGDARGPGTLGAPGPVAWHSPRILEHRACSFVFFAKVDVAANITVSVKRSHIVLSNDNYATGH